jgi:hypothetical protein
MNSTFRPNIEYRYFNKAEELFEKYSISLQVLKPLRG